MRISTNDMYDAKMKKLPPLPTERATSPIGKSATFDSLPNELVENVFELAAATPLPVDDNYPQYPLFSKMPATGLAAYTVSQVSRRWRDISISMPMLWSNIHISRSPHAYRRLKRSIGRSLEWLPLYLERAKNLPLHITIDCTRFPDFSPIMGLIAPCSGQWCTLTILVSHVGNLPTILPLLAYVSVPKLEHMRISADIWREGIVSYEPLTPFFLSSSPRLTSLRLDGVYLAWNTRPLQSLTVLELRFTTRWPEFSQLKEMLEASPLMQRLVIQDDITTVLRNVERSQTFDRISMSQLQYLEIAVYRVRDEEADVAGLIDLFSIPALETLALRGVRESEWMLVADNYFLPRDPSVFMRDHGAILSRMDSFELARFPFSESLPFLANLSVQFVEHDVAASDSDSVGSDEIL